MEVNNSNCIVIRHTIECAGFNQLLTSLTMYVLCCSTQRRYAMHTIHAGMHSISGCQRSKQCKLSSVTNQLTIGKYAVEAIHVWSRRCFFLLASLHTKSRWLTYRAYRMAEHLTLPFITIFANVGSPLWSRNSDFEFYTFVKTWFNLSCPDDLLPNNLLPCDEYNQTS